MALIVERAITAVVVLAALLYLSRRVWRRSRALASPRIVNGPCGHDCGCD